MLLNPQPSNSELGEIYNAQYFLGDDTPEGRRQVSDMKQATARVYLREIGQYRGGHGGNLLEIGSGQGEFLVEAQRLGYDVTGVEYSSSAAAYSQQLLGAGRIVCGEIESVARAVETFDIIAISDVIEHTRNPVDFLAQIHRLLKPGGTLFIATPSLDSWSARLLQQRWMEFKPEHLTYFDSQTIQHALFQSHFGDMIVRPCRKILNLGYVAHHFERFRVPLVSELVTAFAALTPQSLRDANIPIVASGMNVFATAKLPVERRLLSIIIPAFNESATIATVLDAVITKHVADLDIEIIVVESNSGDDTRTIVQRYADHPRVRVILEDKPRGKGHAVRTGLAHATGDFILIQDADLEYDLEDYDILLEPLVQGREAFVLGARHGGSAWKMRHFADNQLMSTALNGGHWFFTTLVNVLFGQRLKDPFTMYKVFRRDCLTGLTFECNRFDFDYELLIKLVRKGYKPVEIPVNYSSRSFREGKKVSVWRDPLTWFRALAKLRVATIDPLAEVARQRRAAREQGEQA